MMYNDGKRKKAKAAAKSEKEANFNNKMFEIQKMTDRLERPNTVPKKNVNSSLLVKALDIKLPRKQ